MRFVHSSLRSVARVALCLTALGSGAATARYTDIARHELNLWPTRARAAAPVAPPAPTAQRREAAAAKSEPLTSPLLAAIAGADDAEAEEDHPAAREPDGFAADMRDGVIMKGATPHRLILFTFDDGPDRATTPKLLDRLDAAGVRAVFFLTGSNLRGVNVAERKNIEIAREALRRGHILASHGMNHRQLPLLSDAEALLEIKQTEAVFERVLGSRPWLLRPPGGAHSSRIDRLLKDHGYTMMLWNLGAGDFQVRTAQQVHDTWAKVLERREAQGENGGIVLLHDTYSWSVEAFQLIVDDLLARNCALLANNEELYDFIDDPRVFFQPRGDADASDEATPIELPRDVLEERQARIRQETAQRCEALGG